MGWPARPWALPARRGARGSSGLPRAPANYSLAAPRGASSASGGGGGSPGPGPSPVLREQAGRTAVPRSAGRRAALPGAKVEGEVSRARPPHSRPRPPAFFGDATPPPPPLRPRGLGRHRRRRPSCLHRPAPHTAAAAFSPTQSRCRLGRRHLLRRSLISLEHLPATGHRETETPAAPAGNSPATARGYQAVRAPAAFPPLSSGRSTPSATTPPRTAVFPRPS